MKPDRWIIALVASVWALATPAMAQKAPGSIERLYVMECGQGEVGDLSRWSPGVNVGTKTEFVTNCYLIKHAQGYMLWETGLEDALARVPEGRGDFTRWRLKRTLAAQLEEIGVKAADIKFVAASHSHPDHIGNVEQFPQSMLLIQKAEYEWLTPTGASRYKAEHPVRKLEGDFDVFGDGSVTLLSTPGHTPGHQSILIRLARTGPVVISGDAAHFKENWDFRRVPSFNVDVQKTLTSMDRIAAILAHTKAQLWIHHDKQQADGQKKSPAYYD